MINEFKCPYILLINHHKKHLLLQIIALNYIFTKYRLKLVILLLAIAETSNYIYVHLIHQSQIKQCNI
jgi:hypothetical protein